MMSRLSPECHVPPENQRFDYSPQFGSHRSSHFLLGMGLSSSPTPCASPSTRGEPKAQRSDQSIKGHPPHTSVQCCTAPLSPLSRDTPTMSHRHIPSARQWGRHHPSSKPLLFRCRHFHADTQTGNRHCCPPTCLVPFERPLSTQDTRTGWVNHRVTGC